MRVYRRRFREEIAQWGEDWYLLVTDDPEPPRIPGSLEFVEENIARVQGQILRAAREYQDGVVERLKREAERWVVALGDLDANHRSQVIAHLEGAGLSERRPEGP